MADIKDIKLGNTKYNIKIPSSRVKSMADYAKPSSKPSPEAIQQSDTLNAALGKLEYKADTNQTNILYALKTGANNLSPVDNVIFAIPGGEGYTKPIPINLAPGEYVIQYKLTTTANSAVAITYDGSEHPIYDSYAPYSDTVITHNFTVANSGTSFRFYFNQVATVSELMIVPKEVWDTVGHDFMPPALPNSELTKLESEDRAALAEVVDEGSKNKALTDSFTIDTSGGYVTNLKADLVAGEQYVISFKTTAPSSGTLLIGFKNSSGTPILDINITINDGVGVTTFTCPSGFSYYNVQSYSCVGTYSDFMICTEADWKISQKYAPYRPPYDTVVNPFFTVPINHNMIYRGQNLGETFTEAQDTALSSGNFTDLYLGDYWTKTVTIPAGTYTGGDGESVDVPAQTNITLKAVIVDFDTFFGGYESSSAIINTHHAAIVVTGFGNVVWNKTRSTAGGYANSLIHKWLVGSALPQIETWFGSNKVLSHQKLLTDAITGDAASSWAWGSEKISLLSENQIYGSKIWGGSRGTNGAYEPGEAFKHLNVFNHVAANLLFNSNNIWLRDIGSAAWPTFLNRSGSTGVYEASSEWIAPAALILLS